MPQQGNVFDQAMQQHGDVISQSSAPTGTVFDQAEKQNMMPVPTGTISAVPQGILPRIEDQMAIWKNRLLNTGGMDQGTRETMASLPAGLAQMGQGMAQGLQGRKWQGTQNMVGGGLRAATIPASFVAPEVAEGAAEAAPSAKWAGKMFDTLKTMFGAHEVPTPQAAQAASKVMEINSLGGRAPKMVTDFLEQTKQGPLTYQKASTLMTEATNFSRNLTEEARGMSDNMRGALADFVSSLRSDLSTYLHTNVSDNVGNAYDAAVSNYRQAKTVQRVATNAAKVGAGAGLTYAVGKGGAALIDKLKP